MSSVRIPPGSTHPFPSEVDQMRTTVTCKQVRTKWRWIAVFSSSECNGWQWILRCHIRTHSWPPRALHMCPLRHISWLRAKREISTRPISKTLIYIKSLFNGPIRGTGAKSHMWLSSATMQRSINTNHEWTTIKSDISLSCIFCSWYKDAVTCRNRARTGPLRSTAAQLRPNSDTSRHLYGGCNTWRQ